MVDNLDSLLFAIEAAKPPGYQPSANRTFGGLALRNQSRIILAIRLQRRLVSIEKPVASQNYRRFTIRIRRETHGRWTWKKDRSCPHCGDHFASAGRSDRDRRAARPAGRGRRRWAAGQQSGAAP